MKNDNLELIWFWCSERVYQQEPDWLTMLAVDLIALTNEVHEFGLSEESCMGLMSTVA